MAFQFDLLPRVVCEYAARHAVDHMASSLLRDGHRREAAALMIAELVSIEPAEEGQQAGTHIANITVRAGDEGLAQVQEFVAVGDGVLHITLVCGTNAAVVTFTY